MDLEPWDETARRQVMRLLARSGRRAEALAQYEACRAVLADELRVEPETETKTKTTQLAGRIRDGELEILPATHARPPTLPPPCFLIEGTDDASLPLFVARDQEPARFLATFADQALEGTGRVAFVTGGPGQARASRRCWASSSVARWRTPPKKRILHRWLVLVSGTELRYTRYRVG